MRLIFRRSIIETSREVVCIYNSNFPTMEKALLKQPDIAIGLGLFEAMHILDGGRGRKAGDAASLLDEVIG